MSRATVSSALVSRAAKYWVRTPRATCSSVARAVCPSAAAEASAASRRRDVWPKSHKSWRAVSAALNELNDSFELELEVPPGNVVLARPCEFAVARL